MKVCHYTDLDVSSIHPMLGGGFKTSILQQRKAMDMAGIEWTTDPWEDHDILHVNQIGPGSIFHVQRAKRNGTPVVCHVHVTGEAFQESFRGSRLLSPVIGFYTERWLYSDADFLIPVSDWTRECLEEEGIDVPMRVITNAVDGETLDGHDDIEDAKETFDVDGVTVVNLGNVFERKGLDDFLAVGERMPDTDFVWAGPMHWLYTPRSTLKKTERSPDNVRFPGFVDDKREVFAAGDIFFFPSLENRETQGIAILEAMYCGLPVVVRDTPTYEGWLEHGRNCLKADSVDGFVDAIERLRDDPELRAELGANAQEDVMQEHTIDHLSEQLADVYRTVLDGA